MLLSRLSNIGIVDVAILFLAVYRLSVMLHHDYEHGPNGILDRIKFKLGVEESSDGALFGRPGTLAEGLLCYYCNSTWIGLAFILVFALLALAGWQALARLLFFPLAASGLAVLLGKYTEK